MHTAKQHHHACRKSFIVCNVREFQCSELESFCFCYHVLNCSSGNLPPGAAHKNLKIAAPGQAASDAI